MAEITVQDYTVFTGDESLEKASLFLNKKKFSEIFLLADQNTSRHCLPVLKKFTRPGIFTAEIITESGEQHKNIASLEKIISSLLQSQADRNSLLVNLGGGVIGDSGGFAASAYKRGIVFVNIPTTLLSMVDASVGGKTGINFEGIKNVLGTFTNPEAVFIYPGFLKTLPETEMRSGFAEMIKHGLISGGNHWNRIKAVRNISNFAEDLPSQLIEESIAVKKEIVEKDSHENDLRRILNFGHTIGHAFESYFLGANDAVTHGEAITYGMKCELYLSNMLAGFSSGQMNEALEILDDNFNGKNLPSIDRIGNFLKNDKKNSGGEAGFYLLKAPGEPAGIFYPSEKLIKESIEFISSRKKS